MNTPSSPQQANPSIVPSTCAQRLLLVEDNPVNQKLALILLQRLGYQADLAVNGVEALTAVTQGDYHLILMDMQMPQMDGLEATRRIRAMGGHGATVPIIALTANAMASDRDTCLQAGMNDFLSKPFMLDALTQCLTRWLSPDPAARR